MTSESDCREWSVWKSNCRGPSWGLERSGRSLSANLTKAWVGFTQRRRKTACSRQRACRWNVFNFTLRKLYLIHGGIGLFEVNYALQSVIKIFRLWECKSSPLSFCLKQRAKGGGGGTVNAAATHSAFSFD